MSFEIEYFHERVLRDIESWPVDVLADYARLVELLIEHGPSLRPPHSRAFGDGLFELSASRSFRHWQGVLLLSRWQTGYGPALLHQEVSGNTRPRTEVGAKAHEGDFKWLN